MKKRKTLRKLLSVFLAILMLGGAMVPAYAVDGAGTDFRLLYEKGMFAQGASDDYEESESYYIRIIGYEGTVPADLEIPAEIEETPVRYIAQGVFRNCDTLRTLNILSDWIELEKSCFSGCKNLESVEGESIFADPYTFCDCAALKTIGVLDFAANCAFFNCTALTEVTLGSATCWIGENVFLNCSSLQNVHIGGYYESLMYYAHHNETGNSDFYYAKWDYTRFSNNPLRTNTSYNGQLYDVYRFQADDFLATEGYDISYTSLKIIPMPYGDSVAYPEEENATTATFYLYQPGTKEWAVLLLDENGDVVMVINLNISVEEPAPNPLTLLWNAFLTRTLPGRMLKVVIDFVRSVLSHIK